MYAQLLNEIINFLHLITFKGKDNNIVLNMTK